MREIRFRAWDNVENKMYFIGEEDEIVFSFESSGIVATDISENYTDEFKTLHHLIYMQYTGLEGIYEGDVLYGEEIGEYGSILSRWQGVVYWDEEKCGFYVKDPDDIDDAYRLDDYDYSKIIGNIHENPELLNHG